jgi:hypothetical protein
MTAWRYRSIALALAACALASPDVRAQGPALESNLKAVFLFNFAKYVTWPAVQMGERSPQGIRVCVTADDDFFGLLKAAIQGEEVDGKPMQPVALTGLDEARGCQILYVGDVTTADARAWLGAVRTAQVLTVGDGATNDEPVISFVREETRVRFDVNRAAAGRHGVNISAKLLRLARQVKDR